VDRMVPFPEWARDAVAQGASGGVLRSLFRGVVRGLFDGRAARALARFRSLWWLARMKLDAAACGGRVEVVRSARLRTRVVFRGRGTVRIGEHAVLGDLDAGRPGAPILLAARNATTFVEIGAGARVANGVELIATERIEIGERFLAGAGARILDSDFHGVAREERSAAGRAAGVLIGDDVWLGMAAMVLKGVSIGGGAVIGAGSVVVRDVPAGAVISGHPARLLAMYARAAKA
jgi:acetyltransferase-like isoleucine patch superfamily enzyme